MSIMQLTQTIQLLPPTLIKPGKYSNQPALPGLEPEQIAPPTVTNRQIAEALSSIAELLEYQNSNTYRIQAYRNAARGVLELQEPAVAIFEELGIDTPAKLWWAAHQHRIRKLHGFGIRSEARLKAAAGHLLGKTEQTQLGGV